MIKAFHFFVNDKIIKMKVEAEHTLLWVLRTELNLTGTKYGCGEGFCGSCTVLVDNEPVRSCQFPMKNADGKKIITIEGLRKNGKLHSLQQAFIKHDALQCGYCTPGMILNAQGLLLQNPHPTRAEIIENMEENLCRCGSYNRIVDAIQTASRELEGGIRK
ncbi:(2Fe-2S)-binding protein [candidate division KSB1 bacterium]|nr:(2Fe-2S)-binding protein [candidate division KSB1 bacterium]